jgi:hypothetical protein
MAQIDRKFERKLKRIDPINDQIKKIISIKPLPVDRWLIGWSDRKMSAIGPTVLDWSMSSALHYKSVFIYLQKWIGISKGGNITRQFDTLTNWHWDD